MKYAGIIMTLVGLCIYTEVGPDTYRDWWVNRWAAICCLIGVVLWWEGLRSQIVSETVAKLRSRPPSEGDDE